MTQNAGAAPPRRALNSEQSRRRVKSPLREIVRAVVLAELGKAALAAAAILAGAVTLVSCAT